MLRPRVNSFQKVIFLNENDMKLFCYCIAFGKITFIDIEISDEQILLRLQRKHVRVYLHPLSIK